MDQFKKMITDIITAVIAGIIVLFASKIYDSYQSKKMLPQEPKIEQVERRRTIKKKVFTSTTTETTEEIASAR